ncbi:MAG: hypothetical protein NC078_11090, partial [Ruminococcus sp.]|nr:hypothetical protein [Ruminococcus sp.]
MKAADTYTSKLNDLMVRIREKMKKDDRYSALSIYLNSVKLDPQSTPFGSVELAAEVTERIMQTGLGRNFSEVISECEEIYARMLPFPEAENAPVIRAVFLRLLDKGGVYFSGLHSDTLFGCFADPTVYLWVTQSLLKIKRIKENPNIFGIAADCSGEARAFFADERQFGAWVIFAAQRLAMAEDTEFAKEELLRDVRRSSGVYDINEESIAAAEESVRAVKRILEQVNESIEALGKRADSFSQLADSCENDIKERALNETARLRQETSDCSLKIKKAYEDILEGERRSLQFDRDKLLREIFDSADSKIRELKMVAESIRSSTAGELYRINTEANKAAERAASMLQSGELKEIMEDLRKNEDLVEKIVRVENFSKKFDEEDFDESNIEALRETRRQRANIQYVRDVSGGGAGSSPETVYENSPAALYGGEADDKVNFYLDESVPFEERMASLHEKKISLEAGGEIFHQRQDRLYFFGEYF